MKTNKIKLVALAGLLFYGTSCDDQLDLKDPNNIGPDIVYSTDKNVKSALLGAYNGLSAGGFFGGNTFRNSEILADNNEITFTGTFNDVSDMYRKEMITANTDVNATWTAAYNTINIANNVLSSLSVVTAADKDQVEGEALFLRGISYFELILFFGQPYSAGNTATNLGVPLMLTTDRNSVEQKPRSTVAQVYTQIIADLTAAETKLAEGPNPNYATKEAASAFLSRVYLQMADYANARDAANRAIATGNYDLTPTVAAAFNGASTVEDLFAIPVSSVDGVNNMNTFYASATNGGRGDIEVLPAHLALYEAGDARASLFYIDSGTGDTRVSKWINRYGSVKVVRLAEMYLTRAEANQRLGTSIGATPLADVDLVRARAGLGTAGTATLSVILNERRLELAHEGQRLHDIKRTQGNVTQGIDVYPYNDTHLVFPVPQREINVNKNLVQNDGYL
ncbi:MAG TPA: RagB/SusD family nutrient uptake outer membrane protein [Cyclobacteriaceae bacterium]|nr:RagB/SusD family nutrient uptake outer membrane protein [Cyclobacteriaceae bacterium]